MTPVQVVKLIKDDMAMREKACGKSVLQETYQEGAIPNV